MSVRTAADDQLDAARQGVQTVLESLNEVLVKKCSGHDEFKAEYIEGLQQCLPLLFEVERKLR